MKKIYKILLLSMFILIFGTAGGTREYEVTATSAPTEDVTVEAVSSEEETTEEITTGEETTEEVTEAISEEITESEGEDMGAATLYYQGHGSVRITTAEGKVIYVDPYMGDGYDLPADLILVTHGHSDHTAVNLIKNQNEGCRTIMYTEALSGGQHQTFDLDYVKVEAVEAGYNKNHNEKECVGYVFTFSNGVTLYLTGDTSTTPQMKELGERNLDYAFFCCDGVYNMDMAEAIECAKLVGAKHSIPYHMAPGRDFDQSIAETFDVPNRIILKPGEDLVLE